MSIERARAAVTDVVVSVLNAHGILDGLPRILATVQQAVGADVAGYYVHELHAWSTAICIVPDEAWSILPFAQIPSASVMGKHPGIKHLLTRRALAPFAVTDVVSDMAWQHSEFVNSMRANWGKNYQFAIPTTPATAATQAHVWVLGRFTHDFTDADREVCEALAPVLAAVTQHRAVLERLRVQAAADTLLTQRELVVLKLKADGLSALAIASRLSMSPRTAQKHTENIYRKLGVHTRHDALHACEIFGISTSANSSTSLKRL